MLQRAVVSFAIVGGTYFDWHCLSDAGHPASEHDVLDEMLGQLEAAEERYKGRRQQADIDSAPHMRAMKHVSARDYFAQSKTPRSTRSSLVQFCVGDVVRHTHWGYKAIVVGWDEFAKVPESWIDKNNWEDYNEADDPGRAGGGAHWRTVPNYSLLVDRKGHTTYVAQTNLVGDSGPLVLSSTSLLQHGLTAFDEVTGRYVVHDKLAHLYPEDVVCSSQATGRSKIREDL
eukprot:gnl/TRDRNA2_/TRDRNA2_41712_c0_seq1.p1 gnl/TRDRNA2_/TRDRNA2_41712_c0~~gnl/TRDRNA2_/TRDRNA2_41712_c0_seq1.p1  ORF type:complete len:230 (-),score=26.73 gnl/TRDRNA2_/TRDRNA2_41712_c0_seq1:213-902(-)